MADWVSIPAGAGDVRLRLGPDCGEGGVFAGAGCAGGGDGRRAGVRDRLVPNPKAKLRDRLHEVARYRQVSLRTEEAYWEWVVRFLKFHREKVGTLKGQDTSPRPSPHSSDERGEGARGDGWRRPEEMGGAEVREFLAHLAVERRVAVSTQNQALNALVFLYREVVGREFGALGEYERPQRRERLPVVLTKEEVRRVLGCVEARYRLFLELLYGTGMRLLEGLRLRVHPVR